jgi:glutathione S-transferase
MTSNAVRETARAVQVPAKLHYSSASPFVRKVTASAIELGLDGHFTFEAAANPTIPTVRNPAIAADNPLSKVPTLVLPDGEQIFDSIVICEYLDGIDGRNKLFPASGLPRWRALRANALADGILDAGVSIRLERIRPEDKRWSDWIDGQMLKINGSLDLLESSFSTWSEGFNIGHIAVSCALQWLEFREIVESPRKTRERLYAWQDEFLLRPSMARTEPK